MLCYIVMLLYYCYIIFRLIINNVVSSPYTCFYIVFNLTFYVHFLFSVVNDLYHINFSFLNFDHVHALACLMMFSFKCYLSEEHIPH